MLHIIIIIIIIIINSGLGYISNELFIFIIYLFSCLFLQVWSSIIKVVLTSHQ